MAAVDISTAHNEARLTATRDFLDAGASAGKLQVYTSTRPVPGAAPVGGTMLVEITLNDPCGSVAAGVLTLTQTAEATAVASGAPTWARFITGGGAWAIDCDAGGPGSGQPVIVSDASILAGGKVSLLSGVLG